MSKFQVGFSYEEQGTCIVEADSMQQAVITLRKYLDYNGLDGLKVDIQGREFQSLPYVEVDEDLPATLVQPAIDWTNNRDIIYNAEDEDMDGTGEGYTAADILELCEGDEVKAQRVYDLCEWQHVETIIDEMDREDQE